MTQDPDPQPAQSPTPPATSPAYFLRGIQPSDVKFVMDTWLRSWRENEWAGCIPNHLFSKVTRTAIEELVMAGATFTIAAATSRPDRILGWVCHDTTRDGRAVVHYLYVKNPFVKEGVPEALVAAVEGYRPGLYSHRTRQLVRAAPDWGHAPELCRRKK